jgi:divalent metal cation (Fe/Co/Zn/Cd) transporter
MRSAAASPEQRREPSLTERHWRIALRLAWFTILYNLVEGLVSVYFGIQDETLVLFGFGIDSFIEFLSGAGIMSMVLRVRRNPDGCRSRFEQAALRVTGTAFFLLAGGLVFSAIFNLVEAHRPETTLPGVIISTISIAIMWILVMAKRKVGRALRSAPILADANCTLACIYMSLVLLVSSLVFQVTGFGFADALGAIGLVYFSLREGREAFEKARGLECASTAGHDGKDDECDGLGRKNFHPEDDI